MNSQDPAASPKSVERLYPFARRARVVVSGRAALRANLRRLHFVLIAEGMSEVGRASVEEEFGHVPVVQKHAADELGELLGCPGARVVGFLKSEIARSIYRELKAHRVAAPTRQLASRRRTSTNVVARVEETPSGPGPRRAEGAGDERPRRAWSSESEGTGDERAPRGRGVDGERRQPRKPEGTGCSRARARTEGR
ncbi:MAG: hypothetical protein H6713_43110, partial [Myxococcales bacterium]|nr:hypothetical protein [Myxococcales bacterium]